MDTASAGFGRFVSPNVCYALRLGFATAAVHD